MKKILFFLLAILCTGTLAAQQQDHIIISTDTLSSTGNIEANTWLYIDSSGKLPVAEVAKRPFVPLLANPGLLRIRASDVSFIFYQKLTISNPSAVAEKFFHYPGKLFKDFDLFVIGEDGSVSAVNMAPVFDGFVPLTVKPGKTTFLLRLKCFKVQFSRMESKLIASDQLDNFKNGLFQTLNNKKVAGMVLSGMLLMMILVTLLNFIITRKVEFLYNSGYSLCMFLLIYLTTYLTLNPSWFKGFFMSYMDLLLLIVGTISYLAFTRYFLNTSKLHPRLDKFLRYEAWVLAILMLIYTILFYGTKTYQFEIYLENLMKILMLIAALVYIVLSFVKHNPLMNYLAVGVSSQLFFSCISLILILSGSPATHIYDAPIFYFELGVICSVIFFLLGVFYKNRQELILRIQEQRL